MKKKTKLALSILEKELNVLSKIETLHVLGGADPNARRRLDSWG
ncbi:Uncharacterised protein [Sphingobacterium mizutaii]|uniref:Uncharacterized protein n=1 Tax=Sphingobacterium mizutaii TaxID=1010 RepID=A0AAJ4X982_9SPHI|nr:hypothetical protein [Sphingobacterium mizutaii]SDL78156.1 hypothetical protein SAMN05192578_10952 [Sphingobacterium mizutaii]SNV37860.1 Uncharacterised protein [Sphingobacterium mizutaii]